MGKKVQSTVSVTDNSVMLCLLFIVLGVLFCWLEGGVAAIAVMTVGVIATVLGLFELFHQNWIMGIIEVLVGVALILVAALAPDVVILVLGIAMLLFAVLLLLISFIREGGIEGIYIAIGAISLAAGVIMLIKAAITGGRKAV